MSGALAQHPEPLHILQVCAAFSGMPALRSTFMKNADSARYKTMLLTLREY